MAKVNDLTGYITELQEYIDKLEDDNVVLLAACEDFIFLEKTNMTKKQVRLRIDIVKQVIEQAKNHAEPKQKCPAVKLLYVLIKWPESQVFMEHDEFIPAGNYSNGDELSSAGFIPVKIYEKMLDTD